MSGHITTCTEYRPTIGCKSSGRSFPAEPHENGRSWLFDADPFEGPLSLSDFMIALEGGMNGIGSR
jgi:hypothetical protein